MKTCRVCNSPITSGSKKGFCVSCGIKEMSKTRSLQIGTLAPRYIDNRTNKQYYCINCEKEITASSGIYGSGLCGSCSTKKRLSIPKNNPMFGIRRFGNNNPNYKDGRTNLNKNIKGLEEYYNWRKEVFSRDDYICQECGIRGSNLEVHHIKSFSILINEFLNSYKQFSPIEDKETLVRLAITYLPFWDIDNGKTLCKDCHKKTFIKKEQI